MGAYLELLNIATVVVFVVAVYFLFVRETETIYVTHKTRLLNRVTWGLFLICSMISVLLPTFFSPKDEATGRVTGFRHVEDYRSDHFEFQIEQTFGTTAVLRADYFDKGFFFQDPAVSDGDVIAARWLDWTNEVVMINVLRGRHEGWSYEKSQRIFFPSLALLAGIGLFLAGIGLAIRSSTTKQLDPPGQSKPTDSPGSILGL
jgi:hypothetical protein